MKFWLYVSLLMIGQNVVAVNWQRVERVSRPGFSFEYRNTDRDTNVYSALLGINHRGLIEVGLELPGPKGWETFASDRLAEALKPVLGIDPTLRFLLRDPQVLHFSNSHRRWW